MQCPLCIDAPLEAKFFSGTEVDICPTCRGIWLDRGELDQLLGDGSAARGDRRFDEEVASHDAQPAEPRSGKKRKSRAKRLADLFEEVLDL